MFKIKLISVGKIKQKYFDDAIRDYLKRIGSTYKIEHIIVETANYPANLNDTIIKQLKEKEGQNILKRIDDRDYVISLNLHQNEMDSLSFNKLIQKIKVEGYSTLVFVIGGSYGLGENILKRSQFQVTLSKMTLIHEMAIIFTLEQIYRSINIENNTPYHK